MANKINSICICLFYLPLFIFQEEGIEPSLLVSKTNVLPFRLFLLGWHRRDLNPQLSNSKYDVFTNFTTMPPIFNLTRVRHEETLLPLKYMTSIKFACHPKK